MGGHVLDHIFILLGATCFIIIGMFELDSFNRYMVAGHYVGVALSMFNLIAFNYQQLRRANEGLAFALFLDVVAMCGFASWQLSLRRGREYIKKYELVESVAGKSASGEEKMFDSKYISKLSFVNLLSEASFFYRDGHELVLMVYVVP